MSLLDVIFIEKVQRMLYIDIQKEAIIKIALPVKYKQYLTNPVSN